MGRCEQTRRKKEPPAYREMTPAHVREAPGAEFVEVMFLESARIYKLFKNNPKLEETVKSLRAAIPKKRVVRVRLDQPHGGVIEHLDEAG